MNTLESRLVQSSSCLATDRKRVWFLQDTREIEKYRSEKVNTDFRFIRSVHVILPPAVRPWSPP